MTSHNIRGLAAAYAKGALSPVEVVGTALNRLERLNPLLNAYFLIDREAALAQATESESRWQRNAPRSLVDGMPTSVKDGLAAIGWPSYRGSIALRDPAPATADAPCIARLREAGAVFLGKTTMPDFGILASGYSSQHGVTRNPRNRRFNSGGSSSGAAAAVAAEIDLAAIGTDIVGSVRLPASFCGLFGLKPSQGRVPYYPPNDPALAAGPLTRSVEDAAILMNLITQPDARDFTALEYRRCDYVAALEQPVAGARVGFLRHLGFGLPSNNEIISPVARAALLLERAGCLVQEIDLEFDSADLAQAEFYYKTRCFAEFALLPPEKREAASVIRDWTTSVSRHGARELFEAMSTMRRMRERVHSLFDSIDFLVLPTVHIAPFAAELPAPDSARPFEPWANTFLFNLTEQPASSVPCGVTAAGLPVGIQIVGRRFDDAGVLRLSHVMEQLLGPLEYPTSIDAQII
jgi:aspartyl-tRNA(Asn)/glutamyl-tRNA(Gln) amidotransferase subunit A